MTRLPAAKRREQLLATAARVFAKHGYAGATTAELARAAGVTEPIIYRHFASKRDLFIALIERTSEETLRLWQLELASAEDPGDRLRKLIGANPMVTTRGRMVYRVIVQALTQVEDPAIHGALRAHIERLHAFLASEVGAAQDAGQVSRRFGPDLTAWALIHMGLGYGVLSAMGSIDHGTDRGGMHVQDLLLELMLGERAKRATTPGT